MKMEQEEVELYECERCGNKEPLEQISDEYPYNVTYCVNCVSIWQDLMSSNNFEW